MHRSRSHRWAAAWRSLPLRLAAIVTSVAVVASLAVMATPAIAAEGDPAITDVALAQHSQVTPWSVSGTTSTASYPGNMSAFGPITINAPAQTSTFYSDTSLQMKPLTIPSGCLGSNTAVGYTAECVTHTTTVTFPHAVINPVMAFATGAQSEVSPSTQCAPQWQDVSFTAINGAAPAASQVAPQRAVDPQMSWASNRLSYLPSVLQAAPCTAPASPYAYLRIGGLISSVTLTFHTMRTITYNPSGAVLPDPKSVSRGVHTFLWLPRSDLSVAKTGPSTVEAGGQISWQIRVTNASGSSPSHGFVVHDAVPAGVTNVSITSGQPECSLSGNDLVCSRAPAGWAVSQNGTVETVADLSGGNSSALIPSILNAGATYGPIILTGTAPTAPGATLTNGATVSGADVDEDITNNMKEVTTTITDAPSLSLVKSATSGGAPITTLTAGETIDYSFLVKNTGTVPLSGIAITDTDFTGSGTLPAAVCPPGDLAPGDSTTCTSSYVVTAADAAAGVIDNTAVARGTAPGAPTPTQSEPSTAQVPLALGGQITLRKTGSLAGAPGLAGDTVHYSFVATNTGGVTLNGVTITDPLPGLSALTYSWPGTPGTLLPNEEVHATATYTLTQADVDAGSVVNTAATSGTDPGGDTVTANDSATVGIPPAPAISLVKTGGLAAGATGVVGDTVEYSFVASNPGNVTLTGVTIADPLPGLSPLTYDWSGTPGTLLPGESVSATATYVLTQADIDAGSVVNTATATGTDPANTPVSADDSTTVSVLQAPGISLVKTGAVAAGATGVAGDTVEYTFVAANTGNVTLTGVTVADPLPGLSALTYTWPGTPGTLLPGEEVPATATYVLTQADVDAGAVVNTATASGTDSGGTGVTADDTATVPISSSAIALVKTGALAAGATGAAGDVVEYTFQATNTGNVTLTGVSITDPLPGLSALTYSWPGTPGTLLPGQVVPATATYVLTQADVDAGSVVNTATATGTDPGGDPVTGDDTTTVSVTPTPGIVLVKTGGLAAGATGAVGDTVEYSFVATNSGNVTLTGVTIADPLPGLSALTFTWPGTPGTLLPGESVSATATYVLTQADVDAGSVVNTATATGTDPGGDPVTGDDTVTVDVPQNPAIALVKTGGLAAGATGAVGDTVDYTFAATNSGTVTLTGVSIADPLPGLSALTFTWPGTPGTLLPGQTATATAAYVLTQADVDAGSVVNTATATGTDPGGTGVTADDTATVPISSPAIVLAKSGALAAGATGVVGDTVEYSFVATNSGNVTLTGVTIADPLPGLSALTFTWPGTPGTLLPGESVSATATYVLTQADVDAGSVVNTATATGTDPDGDPVTGDDTTTVDVPQNPGIVLVKTGGLAAGATGAVGDTVEYSFVATNSGNVTLTGVTITDPLPGLSALTFTWPGTPGTLLPGQTAPATATYVLTQADVDAGSVVNTATATGTDPTGDPVTGDDTTTVDVPQNPGIALVKTGGLAAGATGVVGDTIDYAFAATNSGTVTLTGVTIADPLPGLSALTFTWPGVAGTLLPGQTATATATYVLTQADVDAGSVVNTATATGTDPGGDTVTGDDTTTVSVTPTPGIVLVKTGGLAAGATGAVGDTVEYSFVATNSGNVTLTGVTIADPLPGSVGSDVHVAGDSGDAAPGPDGTGDGDLCTDPSRRGCWFGGEHRDRDRH